MIKLIRKLLSKSGSNLKLIEPSCDHKWKLDRSIEIYDKDDKEDYKHIRKQCVCEKCGEWKTFIIK